MKTVFIAHPIAGDIKANMRRVLDICEQVHTADIIPVVPYLVSLQYLDDTVEEHRTLGIAANVEALKRRFVDELWLFGDRISSGMRHEITIAHECNIPVIPKTPDTERQYAELFPGS